MEGMPGGCNPADVLNKLASNRGIRPPTFELVSLGIWWGTLTEPGLRIRIHFIRIQHFFQFFLY
jgi:hypothetical protein